MTDHGFAQAANLLPAALRAALPKDCGGAEEIRLRTGRRVMVTAAGTEREADRAVTVTAEHLRQVLENATRSSLHTAAESLRRGYVTAENGCRVGVCGTAAVSGGEISSIREISSLCIRVAREQKGVAAPLLDRLWEDGGICGTLIISPPGVGKTTLLRDLVRLLSERGLRTAIADERGELAAMQGGAARFDVGAHTDVLTGAPKAAAVMMLLRTMSPQVIALDEISEACDAQAVELAANSGATLLATVHGRDKRDVLARPVLAGIRGRGIFRRAVIVELQGGRRQFRIEEL